MILRTLLLALAASVVYGAPMGQIERTIRKAYARLSLATQMAAVDRWATEHRGPADGRQFGAFSAFVTEQQVRFAIENVKIAAVRRPLPQHQLWSSVVSKPTGRVLAITTVLRVVSADQQPVEFFIGQPRWQEAAVLSEDWDVPLEKVVRQFDPLEKYTAYAAFDVVATFGPESRRYHALFLLAEGPSGFAGIHPVDNIVGSAVLQKALNAQVPPVNGLLHDKTLGPFVKWFVEARPAVSGCTPEDDVICCDLKNVEYGFSSGRLGTLPAPRRWSDSNELERDELFEI